MKTIRSLHTMAKEIDRLKKAGFSIGFVPTMGYLHEGHVSLLKKGRKENDILVMSIFVNPIQFGPREDFRRYPRDFQRDEEIALEQKVDIIFYPDTARMYPKDFKTHVEVEGLTQGLCGLRRPGHFRGVTTVVAKLFNIVRPDTAYFGQKDAQQALVIKRMVRDLNFPIKIKVLPTVREKDKLAMSSRNVYLDRKERKAAVSLFRSLKQASAMIKKGVRDIDTIKRKLAEFIREEKCARIDYIEIVDRKNLERLESVKRGNTLIALAVYIGKTRLIDNIHV